MRYSTSFLALAATVVLVPSITRANIHYTTGINLTTVTNPGGGFSDGTGVWFNPLTGYSESRGFLFPTPLYTDGQFFLLLDGTYSPSEAEIYTQGFFNRGNGVIYASDSNLNPAYFGDGAVIGPSSGYQNPGAGYTDLGPNFGNWTAGEHGYLGLTIRNPAGASASDIFYGYAEIQVNDDYSITLLIMAYNDVEGQAITTVTGVPEPSVMAVGGIAAVAGLLYRRRASAKQS